ncbi:hypothetical protein C6N75_09990 [Streptomyces solincola]|uniref:Uncharacterized protein n=1 Tax=Streptomyces solincola TaxID=2100817 RepID=A0A2S9PYA9_9ACTN|nr:hypothetical protein [Streptomyces solincola]PRH79404.1 hypothetical protein C6N75_09990 [Streptomyces solincola]
MHKPAIQPPRPEKPEPGVHAYKVVGPHAVDGVQPGDTVELELTEEQEQIMVDAGHLEPVLPDYPDGEPQPEESGPEAEAAEDQADPDADAPDPDTRGPEAPEPDPQDEPAPGDPAAGDGAADVINGDGAGSDK